MKLYTVGSQFCFAVLNFSLYLHSCLFIFSLLSLSLYFLFHSSVPYPLSVFLQHWKVFPSPLSVLPHSPQCDKLLQFCSLPCRKRYQMVLQIMPHSLLFLSFQFIIYIQPSDVHSGLSRVVTLAINQHSSCYLLNHLISCIENMKKALMPDLIYIYIIIYYFIFDHFCVLCSSPSFPITFACSYNNRFE